MSFDFRQIAGPEDSKQENFSSLCNRLIIIQNPSAKPVDGKGGDQGLDTFVGNFNGECHAYQHKYFIDRVGRSQRRQVEESLAAVLKHHKPISWTLMLPINFNPDEIRWFQLLQKKHDPLPMDWWGKDKLCSMLANHPELLSDFTPVIPIQQRITIIGGPIEQKRFDFKQALQALQQYMAIHNPTAEVLKTLSAAARDIVFRARLRILLWGPTTLPEEVADKRQKLCTHLRVLGHEAYVGEDLWTPELKGSGLNLSVAEFLQAEAFDYIVAFMDSPGTVGEVHDFARSPSIASKMMICVDNQYASGYSGQGVLRIFEGHNGKLDWFERPSDIVDCNLTKRILSQIEKVAEAKQWALSFREA